MLNLIKSLFGSSSGPASFTFLPLDDGEADLLMDPLTSYLSSDRAVQEAYIAKVKYTRGGSSEIKPVLCMNSGHTIQEARRSMAQHAPHLLHAIDIMVLADLSEDQIRILKEVGRSLCA
jgi:hypothetical protein